MITIPTPPIHCRIALQISRPGGVLSIVVRMVAPVVVMPDMASKIASVKLISRMDSVKGRALNITKIGQVSVVRIKVCERVMS